MIYNQFDIIVVPFPFTDSPQAKRRPAIILSSHIAFNGQIGHSIMAMITSARNDSWPHDVIITNLPATGLSKASIIRMKFFTIDHEYIHDTVGALAPNDQKALKQALQSVFNGLI